MDVYLASAPANRELNELLVAELEERGHRCVRPGREEDGRPSERARAQGRAIAAADVVLLVGPGIDPDVAWKAGYARALGKRVVLVCPVFETACDHRHLVDEVAAIDSLDGLGEAVESVLAPRTPAGDGAGEHAPVESLNVARRAPRAATRLRDLGAGYDLLASS